MNSFESIISSPLFCNEQKIKRIKRKQQKIRHIERQLEITKTFGLNVEEPHRLHKKNALNCGDPHCAMCGNPRKFFKEKTLQERKNDISCDYE
jgi:hypothetical protein